ncbi:uncharacterized protein LOC123541349 [Mercenaria mercenaria]|uniref:uncharacterized protein LOC123541349 n=1 Tax=Mercenaria mercenaria TaxID=6596 RepID=UPI00234F4B16|nr:uncharacterized protein LOC123541349 [Mercenaria mercenaria]
MAITGLEEVRQMPGFTTILKAVLKSQIQHLVDQLARETQEESLVVATCLEDGTISHLGSELGKDFLEDSADMKSSFLGFCLKRKYRQMSSKDQGPNRSSESADSYVSSPMLELDYTSAQTSSPHPVTLCQVSSFGQGVVQLKQQELSHHGQQNSPGKIRISGKHRHEPYKGKGEQKNKTGSRQEQHKGGSTVQSEDLAVDYINASNNSSSLGEEDGNVSIKIEPLDESDKQLQEETAVDSDTRFPAHLSKGASTDPISGDTNSSPTNKVQTGDATKTIPYPSSVGMYSPSQESFNMENQFSEVIVKIETSVDMYDQEEETSSCSLDLAETKYEKMEQSICEIQSGKEKGIKETVTKPEECLFSEKKNSNGCGLASGNLQGATSDQTTGCTVDQTIVFTGDQNTIDNSNKSTACITEQTTADTSDQISKIELVCDEVTLDSICDQPLSEVISDMVGSISDQPLSDLICDKNTADMIQNCTVELDRLDNLWDMTDDIDNDPDYEEGSSAEDSESCAENSDSDEFSDSTERRDELQEFLPRSTYTKKTPVEIIDLRKASSEIMPCSRPFNEDDFDRCVNCPNIYTKKLSKNSNENSKIGRLYDKVHACFYCRNLKTNIQSHLLNKHGKKEDVSEIKQLQNREKMLQTEDCRTEVRKEIKRKQALLRNKGDDKHNNSICLLKQGELLLVRRRQVKFNSRLYGACPECREWMLLKVNYGKHIKVCPAKTIMSVSSAIVQSMIFKDHIKTNPSKELHEVFSSMLKDDIGYIALGDKLIIALGEAYFLNTYADKLKRKNYSSFRMRLAARLLNLIRKEIGDDNASMSDCMVVENVDIFAKCVLLACGKTNDEELKYPSVALKIVEDLKKMVAAKIAYAAKSRDFQAREEGKLFDDFLTNEWKAKVKNQAAELLKQRQLKKKDPLPDPQDIATLTKFLIENLETIKLDSDITVYRRVVLLTEARLLLYNRQRPGELESLDIETYKKRLASVNETDLSLRNQLTTLENKLMESRELELRGKVSFMYSSCNM